MKETPIEFPDRGRARGDLAARSLRPEDRTKVLDWMENAESASLYHDPRWGEIVEESFGHRSHYLLCEDRHGALAGSLPLVHMKSALFGNFLVSMPFVNYGGIGAEDGIAGSVLLQEAIRIANRLGGKFIELRQQCRLDNGLPSRAAKVSMRLDLPESEDRLWDSFPSKLRSQIRGPRKRGLAASVGRFEELPRFYEVFSVNMRDLGTPVYPIRFFENILKRFPERTWIVSVHSDGKPLAAGFLAGFKDRMEIPWASSLRKFNPLGANMLLYWRCLSFAIEKGFTVFDFGRSTPGEGTFRFKEQWGAKPVPLYWHYWVRPGGTVPDLTNRNPKYRLAIALWKRMPVALTRVLGPPIVKNIP